MRALCGVMVLTYWEKVKTGMDRTRFARTKLKFEAWMSQCRVRFLYILRTSGIISDVRLVSSGDPLQYYLGVIQDVNYEGCDILQAEESKGDEKGIYIPWETQGFSYPHVTSKAYAMIGNLNRRTGRKSALFVCDHRVVTVWPWAPTQQSR